MTHYKYEYMKFYDNLHCISRPYSEISDSISRDFVQKIHKIIRAEWEETKNKCGISINIGKEDGLVKVLTLGSHDEKFSEKLIPLLHEIPKYLPHLLNLSVLIDNWKLIPLEFTELRELIEFSVGGNELSTIPPHLFDNMKNLKSIGYMRGKMTVLPTLTKSSFASLEDLSISNCHYLKKIPNLGALVNLRGLEIKNSAIETLPDNLGDCFKLEEIKLTACPNLRKLPESIRKLTSMREFRIYQCGLEELPQSLFKSPNQPNQPNPPLIPMNIWNCPINATLTDEMRENLPPSIYVDPYDEPIPVGGSISVNDTPYEEIDKMTRQDLEEWIEEAADDDEEEMKFLETTIAYQTYMEYLKKIDFIPEWLEKRNKKKAAKTEKTKTKIKEFEKHQEQENREKEKKENEKKKWTKVRIEEG